MKGEEERDHGMEPTLGTLTGFKYPYVDDTSESIVKDVFDKPPSIKFNASHRAIFDVLYESSPLRDREEVNRKYQELIDDGTTREEAIALDVLLWTMDENVEWVLDEYIEEDKATEDDSDV